MGDETDFGFSRCLSLATKLDQAHRVFEDECVAHAKTQRELEIERGIRKRAWVRASIAEDALLAIQAAVTDTLALLDRADMSPETETPLAAILRRLETHISLLEGDDE